MKSPPLNFTIGRGDWLQTIRKFTDEFNPDYWKDFQPVPADSITRCEQAINRKIPDDFRIFLSCVGAGQFGSGGGIYTTQDIEEGTHGPMLMLLGSVSWATDEEHRRFYATRGQYNPAPQHFTKAALRFENHSLLDLLQIGSDGSCCYHQLYVGPEPRPFGYCLLTPEGTEEDKLPDFSAALRNILLKHWESFHAPPYSTPLLDTDFVIEEEEPERF